MRKTVFLVWVLVLILVLVPGCKKKVKPPAAGAATPKDMMRMLPENPVIIFSLDMHKFASLPLFDKMIAESEKAGKKEGEPFENYQDFVNKTGIDFKKDVFYLTFGIYGKLEEASDPDVLGVVNLNYKRERVLKLMKDNQVELAEEAYEGNTIYTVKEKEAAAKGKEFCFAFVDNANLMFGTLGKMKAGLGLFKGKGGNALSAGKNEKYLAKIDTKAIVWLMLGPIPASVKSQASAGASAIGIDLSKAEALIGFFDYANDLLRGELQLLASDEQSNKKIADALSNIKGAGASFVANDADYVQMINAISISSSPDGVKLSISLPAELLNRLVEKAKAQAESMVAPEAGQEESQAEEIKKE